MDTLELYKYHYLTDINMILLEISRMCSNPGDVPCFVLVIYTNCTNYVPNSGIVSETLKMRIKLLESTRNSSNASDILNLPNSLNVCKFPSMRLKFQEWTQISPKA